jgi:hypothetical protein
VAQGKCRVRLAQVRRRASSLSGPSSRMPHGGLDTMRLSPPGASLVEGARSAQSTWLRVRVRTRVRVRVGLGLGLRLRLGLGLGLGFVGAVDIGEVDAVLDSRGVCVAPRQSYGGGVQVVGDDRVRRLDEVS